MKSWVKLYTEINRDADIGTLTWAQRGIWAALLALAGEIDDRDENQDETGALDTSARVAWHLRLSEEELADAVGAFMERGMVDERGGVLYLTNYGTRQRRAPSDRPASVAERVKRHRARVASTSDAACNEDVTSVKRGVTASDTDTDTDSDTEAEVGASSPADGALAQPPQPPQPDSKRTAVQEPEPKRASRADPRTKHAAVQCVRGITGRLPNRALYDEVIRTLGEHPDGKKAATCYQEWVKRGFNPNAMTWLTEWYVNGIPKGPRAGPTGGGLSAVDDQIAAYAEGRRHGDP